MQIYPSILTGSVQEAQDQMRTFFEHDLIETVQIDVVDGVYADNLTITPIDIVGMDTGDLTIDFHLMTEEPMDFVYEIVGLKGQIPIRGVIAQIEKMTSIEDYIQEVKKHQFSVGLSLDLFTPVEEIDEDFLKDVDTVQLMSIEAGFQGQKLNPIIFEKLDELQKLQDKRDLDFNIIVDGGVKEDSLPKLIDAGASGVAVGSILWNSEDPRQMADNLFGDNS